MKNFQYLGGTIMGNIASEAWTSDVGKTKLASPFDGDDNHSQAHLANRLTRGSLHNITYPLTRLVWIALFHSLVHSFRSLPSPPRALLTVTTLHGESNSKHMHSDLKS